MFALGVVCIGGVAAFLRVRRLEKKAIASNTILSNPGFGYLEIAKDGRIVSAIHVKELLASASRN